MAGESWVIPTDFIFLLIIRVVFFYDPSWSESNCIFFLFFYSIRVDPTRTGGPSWSGPTFVPAYFSWKIVKYCIFYEVCMIKTEPHSTLSPQMWCIKKIKDLFARTQIYWQEFVNLSNAKNLAWFVFQEFVFHALPTVIKSHYCS